MPTYSVAEAKNRLPRLIDKALLGEEVIITRRGKPVIEFRPTAARSPPAAVKEMHQWLAARRRSRPGTGLTSVELLDLLYEHPEE